MWIWTANKFAKLHAKRLNWSENIPKSFMGLLFSETPCTILMSLGLSVLLLPKLSTQYFVSKWTNYDANWCNWFMGQGYWTVNFGGSGGQRSRSRVARIRFGGLAEASFWSPLGWVGFLVEAESTVVSSTYLA